MASNQEFNLRWNNHTNNLLQVFLEQLSNESLVDVTLSCETKFVKAHKMVLSACSPYFQEVFRQHTVEHPVIIMNGFRFIDVKAIVEFMYRGEVKVTEKDLQSLLSAAESLQVKGLCTVRKPNAEENNGAGENGANTTSKQNTDVKLDYSLSNTKINMKTRIIDGSNKVALGGVQSIRKRKRKPIERPILPAGLVTSPVTSHLLVHSRLVPLNSRNKQENPSSPTDSGDDLPPMIKIEPPEIRDIDEEDSGSGGWDSPKLVIDTDSGVEGEKNSENMIGPNPSTSGKVVQLSASDQSRLNSLASQAANKEKIPRPPNAFMIFANEWRKRLAGENPTESNKEISIRLGVMWKSLTTDTKELYYSAARQANEDHKRKYPNYFYSPKEARLRKKLKQQALDRSYDAVQLVKVTMQDDGDDHP